ncbi:MAG: SdpI family protein [Bacteroidota bacterium]
MKWNIKRDLLPIGVIIVFIIISLYFYSVLPETVPSHFNRAGEPDGYSSKTFLVLFGIGESLFLYLLLTFIPFIDPFWKKIEGKYNLFLLFRDIALMFSLFIYVLILISAEKGTFEKGAFGIGFGMLFILMGNYLPKLPRNFFFGIRVPWTLASEVVWKKTHLVSGWLFVIAGAVIILLCLFNVPLDITLLATLGPVVLFSALIYPLYLYKKINKGEGLKSPEL